MFSRAKPYYPNTITSDPQGHEFRGLFAYHNPAFSLPAEFIGVKEKFFSPVFTTNLTLLRGLGQDFPSLYMLHIK